jgi:hypothetical protein
MKLIAIILCLFITYQTKAQPWATTGATWIYEYSSFWIGNGYVKIEKTKDTIINNKVCDVLKRYEFNYDSITQQITFTSPYIIKYYTYTSNNKVYMSNNAVSFGVMYDFNANVGDAWQVFSNGNVCSTDSVKIDSTTTVSINGITLKKMYGYYVDESFKKLEFVEKLGLLDMLITKRWCGMSDVNYSKLRCYTDSTNWKYNTNECAYCNDIIAPLNINKRSEITFKIYPNPSATTLTIETNSLINQVNIYNALGQLKQEQQSTNTIDVSQLANGYYIIELIDVNGNSKKSKIIIQH